MTESGFYWLYIKKGSMLQICC